MADLQVVDDSVTVTVGDDGYLSIRMYTNYYTTLTLILLRKCSLLNFSYATNFKFINIVRVSNS